MISIKITHLRGEIDMNGYIDFNKEISKQIQLNPIEHRKIKDIELGRTEKVFTS